MCGFCVANNTELHYPTPRKKCLFVDTEYTTKKKLESISDKTTKSAQNTYFCRKIFTCLEIRYTVS